jgi:hypothetical protein
MTTNDDDGRKFDLAEMRSLLGDPPLLPSENREHYEKMFSHFVGCFMPRDPVELIFLTRLVEESWFVRRYVRHAVLAVERRYRQNLEFRAERAKARHARREMLARALADKLTQNPKDIAQATHLERKVENLSAEVDEILSATPTELDDNRSLELGMEFQEHLDKRAYRATRMFNEALQQFEHYRDGLGKRLREAAVEAIADQREQDEPEECEEVHLDPLDTPTLVPDAEPQTEQAPAASTETSPSQEANDGTPNPDETTQ